MNPASPANVMLFARFRMPPTDKSDDSVKVLFAFAVKLFQLTPLVLSVVLPATVKVDPVVTTVPETYVRVPVS